MGVYRKRRKRERPHEDGVNLVRSKRTRSSPWQNQEAETWVSFLSNEEKDAANSVYSGKVMV